MDTKTIAHKPFVFTGSGGEYFKVWIVNIVLTVLTLGIYSAWAKVRNKRYFYGNTLLDGATFAYRAEPVTILKGRLIAVGLLILYSVVSGLLPPLEWVLSLLLLAGLPWLICCALAFNARYSVYRGLRFDFTGRYGEAFGVFILLPLLIPLTMGLMLPYFAYRTHRFVVEHHRYGTAGFSLNTGAKGFYVIYAKAALLALAVVLVVFPAVGALGAAAD
nr:YjgN family protein [Pseudomonadota bacterium]